MATFVRNEVGNCRLCTSPDTKDNMVACDECDRWFHLSCAKLKQIKEDERWICIKCEAIERKMRTMKLQLEESKKEVKPSTSKPSTSDQTWIIYLKRQALQVLPKFDGSPRDWNTFKNIFVTTTEAGDFSNIENLNRLTQVLEGKAAKSVRQLMINADNVPKIIERLEENFGKPEIIYRELLSEITKIKRGSKMVISEMSDALENLVNNLDQLNCNHYLNDHRLLNEIIRKLPYNLQVRWSEVCLENKNPPTLKDLCVWMQPHARTQRAMNIASSTHHETTQERRNSRVNSHFESKQQCVYCTQRHKIRSCNKFRELNVSEKNDVVKQKRLCLCCLEQKHFARSCPTKRACGIDDCEQYHNRLLHQTKPEREDHSDGITNHHQDSTKQIYYQIVPVTLKNGEHSIETYAFLDAGSSLTLLDEEIADKLKLQGNIDPLCLKWTQNVSRNETTSRRVRLWISGSTKRKYALKGVRTVRNLQLPTQSVNYQDLCKKFSYLQNLPIKDLKNAQPKILIGLNHSHLIVPVGRRLGGEGRPTAIKTKLGWLIFGNISKTVECGMIMIHDEEKDLNDQLQKYFAVEDFGVKVSKDLESKETLQTKAIINKTMKYHNGRYEIGLLWRDNQFQFPDSYNYALQRLSKVEKGLRQSPELKEWIVNTFKEYENKRYIRKLTASELEQPNNRVFYLPHFVTINKNKVPPKPRLVFDAKAKIHGTSFNSALLPGPDQTTSLYGMLVRFREGAVAVCGDIKEMFHQVKIRKQDQHAQRFLWRNCENRDPDIYVMQVMTFGSTCSPACAQA